MAKQNQNKLFEVLMDDADQLSPEDTAALDAERGETTPPAPVPTETPAEPAEPAEPADPEDDEPAEPTVDLTTGDELKPKKKLTGAQARIQELVEERNRAREDALARAGEVTAEREKWARLEERQKALAEVEAQQRHAEEARYAAEIAAQHRATQRPDPTLDPQGAELFDLKERIARQEAEHASAVQAAQQGFNQMRVQQDVNQFTTAWQADMRAYQSQNPDYAEAAKFATEERIKFWESLGKTKDVAAHLTTQESIAIAKEALDHGRSPSQIYHNLAKQWGYKTAAAAAAEVLPPKGTVTAKDKLSQISRGQKLTGLGGVVTNVAGQDDTDIESMTPEQFAMLPEEEYLKIEGNPQLRTRMQRRIQAWELGA